MKITLSRAAFIAAAWWATIREDCPDFETDDAGNFTGSSPGEWMRDTAKRTFGRGIQRNWMH